MWWWQEIYACPGFALLYSRIVLGALLEGDTNSCPPPALHHHNAGGGHRFVLSVGVERQSSICDVARSRHTRTEGTQYEGGNSDLETYTRNKE